MLRNAVQSADTVHEELEAQTRALGELRQSITASEATKTMEIEATVAR